MLSMAIQKVFDLGSSLSLKADTVPPKGIPVQELKYHIATLPFRCKICDVMVNKTYHIHPTLSRHSSFPTIATEKLSTGIDSNTTSRALKFSNRKRKVTK